MAGDLVSLVIRTSYAAVTRVMQVVYVLWRLQGAFLRLIVHLAEMGSPRMTFFLQGCR